MAKDVQDTIKEVLSRVVQDTGKNLSDHNPTRSGGPLSGARGVAAGAGAAALAPVAFKGISKLAKSVSSDGLGEVAGAPGKAMSGLTSKVGDTISSGVGDKVSEKVDQAGGPSGVFSSAIKSALPFGGGDDDEDDQGDTQRKRGVPGAGKGRRMPVQQSIDIGENVETVYNQWTQYECWPQFMHRVKRVTQEDDCNVSFATKIWGKTKEFKAEIITQRPNDRVKWRVTEGITHTGLVTFHEIGPNLTRVMLSLDVDPGSLIEKAARGMRHIKRAARGDLHRFKAFIEMQGAETGAWRGVIEDGGIVEEHDSSYDNDREYSEFEDIYSDPDEGGDSASKKRAQQSGSDRSSRGRSSSGRSSGSRSSSGRSSSRQSSGGRSSSGGSSSGRSSGSRSSSGRGSSSRGSSSRGSSTRGSSSRGSSSNGSSGSSRSQAASRSSSSRSSRSSSGNHSEGRTRSRGRS